MWRNNSVLIFICVLLGILMIPVGVLNATAVLAADSKNIADNKDQSKTRIIVVSSYHREYLWSQATNEGVCAAFLEFGYLDNSDQIKEYTKNDYVESSTAVIKKTWMDTKRKNSKAEIATSFSRIIAEIDKFQPDIILLGDDNAANYIGNQYLDYETPVVFWGINGLPLKYGIIDSLDNPGHNITGVYQKGFHVQCFEYLQKIVPGIKTIAVLSDDTPTGRAYAKRIERYAAEGTLPVQIKEIVITNSFEQWQAKALELQPKVDAFYISTHHTLKDSNGDPVDYLKVAAWHLRNIKKPSATPESYFVIEGFLSTVNDSGFRQGYEAAKIAYKILAKGENPAEIAPYFPEQGPFIVNRQRAKMLGLEKIIKTNEKIIDEYVDTMLALEQHPE
jgi:putative ABC transport system substrate-binding protein